MEVTERQGPGIPSCTNESTVLCDLFPSLVETGELHGTGLFQSEGHGTEHGTPGVGALEIELIDFRFQRRGATRW